MYKIHPTRITKLGKILLEIKLRLFLIKKKTKKNCCSREQ